MECFSARLSFCYRKLVRQSVRVPRRNGAPKWNEQLPYKAESTGEWGRVQNKSSTEVPVKAPLAEDYSFENYRADRDEGFLRISEKNLV